MITFALDKITDEPAAPKREVIEDQKRRQLEAVKALRRQLLQTKGPKITRLFSPVTDAHPAE